MYDVTSCLVSWFHVHSGGLPTGGVCLLGEGGLPTKGLVTRGGMAAPTDKAFSTHPTGIHPCLHLLFNSPLRPPHSFNMSILNCILVDIITLKLFTWKKKG